MWKTSLNFESDEKYSFNTSINSEKENKNEIQNIEWNTKIKTNFWLEFFYSSSIGIMLMEAIPTLYVGYQQGENYTVDATFWPKIFLSVLFLILFGIWIVVLNWKNIKFRNFIIVGTLLWFCLAWWSYHKLM